MKKGISRRRFIGMMGTGAAALWAANIRGAERKSGKPNLLFLWCDQQRKDTMSVYGNTKIHAPNLNKLAAESLVFLNPYDSQPVCTPARSTVMTGLWPHMNGCLANNIPLSKQIPTLPEILNDPDYRTGYFGKWHLGDEIFAQHGFEEWASTEDGYNKYYSKERDPNMRSGYCHFLIEKGYKPEKNDVFSRNFAVRLPIEHCKPKFLEMKAVDFLKRHKGEPFILYVNFLEPHGPHWGPLNDEHDPNQVDLPPNFNDPLEEDEPLFYRRRLESQKDAKTEADWRRFIAIYWGQVTQVDLSIGAILKALEDLGLAENTIVVHTADHGEMMGAHHLTGKTVQFQESVQVPWLMRIPQMGRKQRLIERAVSHIDMVPTVLDCMGRPMEGRFPGQSLLPLARGEKVAEDHVFIEWNFVEGKGDKTKKPSGKEDKKGKSSEEAGAESGPVPQAFIRTVVSPDGWKLCLADRDKHQLFNLQKDPWETTNLYYTGQHGEVITRLRDRIHTWQEKVKDHIKV